MTSNGERQDEFQEGIGPHEHRELELMLAGLKPLAMFVEIVPIESGIVPEAEFAPHVAAGRIVMREVFEENPRLPVSAKDARVRRVLYALPDETWRIDAFLLMSSVYDQQGGWDAGLERLTGKLLGYDDREIEAWLRKMGLSEGARRICGDAT
jgi:hypothetical protein